MVLPVLNLFNKVPGDPTPDRPLLNNVPNDFRTVANRVNSFRANYTRFWRWFKQSPELIGVISVPITDIIGDRPLFFDRDGTILSPIRENKSRTFWMQNRMKETMRAILFDMFVTGDGYAWIGKFNAERRMEIVKEALKGYDIKLKTKEAYNKLLLKASQDEDLKLPKRFDYIASSTTQILNDNFEILGYRQMASGLTKDFEPKEVIHFRYETLDGRVDGFSPVEALFREFSLLYFVKGNMQAYMDNGGHPDKAVILKNTEVGSQAYQRMEEQWRAFKDVRARNGSMLLTGDVDIKNLNDSIRDLEYKELALWCSSNIAFAFNLPVTRIPYLIGSSATKGDAGGIAESGYWNMISEKQDMIEDLLNTQIFLPAFNTMIRFPRKYKQDEIREAQAASMNADTVVKMQQIYKQRGMSLNLKKINELLKVTTSDIVELTDEEMMTPEQRTGLMNQNLLDNMSVEREPDNRKRADTKRNIANDSVNKGMGV